VFPMITRSAAMATLIWTLSSLSSIASDAKLTHLAHLMAEAAVGENAPELAVDLEAGTRLGKVSLRFESTTLADIQIAHPGPGHAVDEATGKVTWLCYTRPARSKKEPPETVWFISSALGPPVVLNMIVVQMVDASKDDGCATVTQDVVFPTFGAPGIGSTAAELKTHFGSLPYDNVRNVYYDATRPTLDGSGKAIYQRLGYALSKAGTVIGIGLAQTTN
jgi:hypothetical protein